MIKLPIIIASTIFTAACSLSEKTNMIADQNSDHYDNQLETIATGRASMGTINDLSFAPIIRDTLYVDTTPIIASQQKPDVLNNKITYISSEEVYLDVIIANLSQLSGVPISLAPNVYDGLIAQKATNDNTLQLNQSNIYNHKVRPYFQDESLTYILNHISALMGLRWNWNHAQQRVELSRFQTQIFQVHAPLVETNFEAQVSSSSNDSQLGQSNISSNMSAQSSLWNSIESTISNLISSGGKYYVDKAFGTVQVTDLPEVLSTIENYLEKINSDALIPISFDIEIIQVQMEENQNFALSFNANINGNSVNIGTGSGATGSNLDIGIVEGTLANTTALLDIMNSIGTVSIRDRIQRFTLNNQATTLQLADKQAYVREIGTVFDTSGIANTTVNVEDLITGITMQLSPSVINSSELQLGVVIDQSRLIGIDEFSPGADIILQQPRTTHSQTMSQLRVRSGQTLMVTGFETLNDNTLVSGPVSSRMWPLGGQNNNSTMKNVTVILITPTMP